MKIFRNLLFVFVCVALVLPCEACSHRQQKKTGKIIENVGEEVGEAVGKGAFFILALIIEEALKPNESKNSSDANDIITEAVVEKGIQVYPDSEINIIASVKDNDSGWNTEVNKFEKQILKSVKGNSDFNEGYAYGWKCYKHNYNQYMKITYDNSAWFVGVLQAMREIHLSRLSYYKSHM